MPFPSGRCTDDFSSQRQITGTSCIAMMQEWLSPVEDGSDDIIYLQDGAPPLYHKPVRGCLSQHWPQRWVGRTTAEDRPLLCWASRSPDLTPCDYVKGSAVYRLYHRICLSSKDESSLPFQKSMVRCCSGYGRKWIFGLNSAVSQKAGT